MGDKALAALTKSAELRGCYNIAFWQPHEIRGREIDEVLVNVLIVDFHDEEYHTTCCKNIVMPPGM